MKLVPLDDRIVVKQSEAEEKTVGGIILPDTAKEKPQRGKIIAVGPGKMQDNGKRSEMSVKKGDEVIYTKYMGNDIQIDGEKYVILHENDVLGVIEKQKLPRKNFASSLKARLAQNSGDSGVKNETFFKRRKIWQSN
jgi:chaperonin GroES